MSTPTERANAAADAAALEALESARDVRAHELSPLHAAVVARGLLRIAKRFGELAALIAGEHTSDLRGEPTLIVGALGHAIFEAGRHLKNRELREFGHHLIELAFNAVCDEVRNGGV